MRPAGANTIGFDRRHRADHDPPACRCRSSAARRSIDGTTQPGYYGPPIVFGSTAPTRSRRPGFVCSRATARSAGSRSPLRRRRDRARPSRTATPSSATTSASTRRARASATGRRDPAARRRQHDPVSGPRRTSSPTTRRRGSATGTASRDLIGTDVRQRLGNTSASDRRQRNTVGGRRRPGTIAFNGTHGVVVADGTRNSIPEPDPVNGGLGIELGADGVTAERRRRRRHGRQRPPEHPRATSARSSPAARCESPARSLTALDATYRVDVYARHRVRPERQRRGRALARHGLRDRRTRAAQGSSTSTLPLPSTRRSIGPRPRPTAGHVRVLRLPDGGARAAPSSRWTSASECPPARTAAPSITLRGGVEPCRSPRATPTSASRSSTTRSARRASPRAATSAARPSRRRTSLVSTAPRRPRIRSRPLDPHLRRRAAGGRACTSATATSSSAPTATLRAFDGEGALLGSVSATVLNNDVTKFFGISRSAGGIQRVELDYEHVAQRGDRRPLLRRARVGGGRGRGGSDDRAHERPARPARGRAARPAVGRAGLDSCRAFSGSPGPGRSARSRSARPDRQRPDRRVPIGSVPIGSVPIGSVPIGSVPIGSSRSARSGSRASRSARSASTGSSSRPCRSTGRRSSPDEASRVQTLTLADVYANPTWRQSSRP